MLYTVRPLERIYANPDTFNSRKSHKPENEDETEAEFREVLLKNGRIVTRREGENYIIERINSTDMTDYLKDEYSPGRNYMDK